MNNQDIAQIEKTLEIMARFVRNHFENLMEEGFTEEQAMQLTRDWQVATISNGANNVRYEEEN